MQLEHRHHVERLGVLVRLRAVELLGAIDHDLVRVGLGVGLGLGLGLGLCLGLGLGLGLGL